MDHECRYQDVIIENVKNIASIEQKTDNIDDKLDKLDEKLDSLLSDIQSLKISREADSFFTKAIKTAAIFVMCLVSNIFWNNISGLFNPHQ